MKNFGILAGILAGLMVLAGIGVLVWLLPPVSDWNDLPNHSRFPLAALIIGVLALVATLLAILAAVAEVRAIFPKQTIRVSGSHRPYAGPDWVAEAYQLVFENPISSPILNSYRIHVRLVHSKAELATDDWINQPSCEQKASVVDELPMDKKIDCGYSIQGDSISGDMVTFVTNCLPPGRNRHPGMGIPKTRSMVPRSSGTRPRGRCVNPSQ